MHNRYLTLAGGRGGGPVHNRYLTLAGVPFFLGGEEHGGLQNSVLLLRGRDPRLGKDRFLSLERESVGGVCACEGECMGLPTRSKNPTCHR